LFSWAALGHETCGHDVLHAYDGLLGEVSIKVRAALIDGGASKEIASYWSRRIDETASDVMGILNMGPAAAVGLSGFFRGPTKAFGGDRRPRADGPATDPPPADIVRGYLAAEVVRRLAFSDAERWAHLIETETDKDLAGSQIVLAKLPVTRDQARA